jgi:MinD-like ATPase involved in chromosome partitioning or flagellar assembly
MKTFWTTFYSYKGGVGRSLALANIAALLVQKGHRIVLLDFDLEAPGLDAFREFKEAKEKPGIVEYVAEFHRNQIAPDITAFVHQVKLSEQLRGKLWIMPSGRKDKAYNHLLSRTRWAELFNDGFGAAFIENWKLSIEQEFNPDYVLIDSRTGLTEIGGVCTTAFPDLVVMLFSLNDQNVDGTASVVRHINEAGLYRPPQLHFVATPVPNFPSDKNGSLGDRFDNAEKKLGIKLVRREGDDPDTIASSIRYWGLASLEEQLFVLNDVSGTNGLVQDYKNLCTKVSKFNRNGLDFYTAQTEDAISTDDSNLAGRLTEVLKREFPERAEAVFLRSRLARLDNGSEDALALAEKAFELDPRFKPPFDFLYTHYNRVKQTGRIEQLCERILSLGACLSLSHRSEVLTTLAELRMSIGKYELAAEHYAEVLRLAPLEKKDDKDGMPLPQMAHSFNAAESGRRAGRLVSQETWKRIISQFEEFPALSGLPTMTANLCQAIHIAYAMVGDISMAKESLRKAIKAVESVNELETIFSARDYRYVNRDEFKSTTEDLLAALDRGELWDGMKLLPAAA